MALCHLMEGTKVIRSPMRRQFLRYQRRWSSLDKIFPKQGGQQLRIFHWDRVKLYEPDSEGYTVEAPVVEVVVDTVWAPRQFAYPNSDLRKIKGRLRSNFEPFSSEKNNAQYHDQVPLDGKPKWGQPYTLLAIFLSLEEAPWFVPTSFQAALGADPYISWGLDQPVFSEHDSVCRAVEEPVVEAVVCTVVDVVVEVAAWLEARASAAPVFDPA